MQPAPVRSIFRRFFRRHLCRSLAVLAVASTSAPRVADAFTLTTTVADSPLSLTIDGFVEGYYSFVLQDPVNGVSNGRLFASRHNSLTVSGASIGFELRYGAAFMNIAPWFGLTPTTIYSGEPEAFFGDGLLVGRSDESIWRYLRAANAGFELGDWKIDAGLFVSPIGIEGIATKDNWLWSSSWQNYLFPFYHFGARVHYTTPAGNTLGLWVVNGFSGAVDANDGKSIIVTAGGSLGRGAWQVLYYGGPERPEPLVLDMAWLHHLDAWFSLPLSDAVEIAAQVDVGIEPNDLGVAWYAAGSAYLRVAFSDYVAMALRGEIYGEQQAESDTGVRSSPLFLASDWVAAGSIALEVRPVPHSAVRLEYRHDQAEARIFFDENPTTPTSKSQDAVTLGLTVWI